MDTLFIVCINQNKILLILYGNLIFLAMLPEEQIGYRAYDGEE